MGHSFVVVLDGRQPACVLRLAVTHFPSPPFYSFSTALTIDCKTGSKTYCTENYDEGDLIALAEELGDEIVPIAGEGGGGLRRYSNDGNTLMSVAPFWPAEKIVFMPNYTLYTLNPEKCTIIFEDYEIKAFGFSKCGNYMAVCNSHTLDIFKKICP